MANGIKQLIRKTCRHWKSCPETLVPCAHAILLIICQEEAQVVVLYLWLWRSSACII